MVRGPAVKVKISPYYVRPVRKVKVNPYYLRPY
jgi:hypothetical protein